MAVQNTAETKGEDMQRSDIPFEPISPNEDEIEDVIRNHPDWSDEQVAAELAGLLVSVEDVAQVRRWS